MSCLPRSALAENPCFWVIYAFQVDFFPKARQGAGVGMVMQRLVWAAALLGQIIHILEGQHAILQFVSPKLHVI